MFEPVSSRNVSLETEEDEKRRGRGEEERERTEGQGEEGLGEAIEVGAGFAVELEGDAKRVVFAVEVQDLERVRKEIMEARRERTLSFSISMLLA